MTTPANRSSFVDVSGNPPQRIRRTTRWETVENVVDAWIIEGRWWDRPERREYYRLLLAGGATVTVYRSDGHWLMAAL